MRRSRHRPGCGKSLASPRAPLASADRSRAAAKACVDSSAWRAASVARTRGVRCLEVIRGGLALALPRAKCRATTAAVRPRAQRRARQVFSPIARCISHAPAAFEARTYVAAERMTHVDEFGLLSAQAAGAQPHHGLSFSVPLAASRSRRTAARPRRQANRITLCSSSGSSFKRSAISCSSVDGRSAPRRRDRPARFLDAPARPRVSRAGALEQGIHHFPQKNGFPAARGTTRRTCATPSLTPSRACRRRICCSGASPFSSTAPRPSM